MRSSLFLFTLLTAFALSADTPEMISARKTNATPPAALQGRGVKRIRPVVLNTSMFTTARVPLRTSMSFFPEVRLIVNWTSVEKTTAPDGRMWMGKVQRPFEGQAILIISGKSVIANITIDAGMVYQIRTMEDGQRWVREVDQKAFPRESEPLKPR